MKTITINRKSDYSRITLLIIAVFLSLSMVMGQEKDLSQVIKDCNTTKSTSIQNYIFVAYNLNSEYIAIETEPSVKIENWMFDINLWVKDQIQDEAEIEDWMMNSNLWNNTIKDDDEAELKIEGWMLNTDLWDNDLSENELEIENWMMNSNLWQKSVSVQNDLENQLKIESWMLATDYWQISYNIL
ncbi:MAG: hypothetical protein ABFS35_01550 [Bacteroidota bacterium]